MTVINPPERKLTKLPELANSLLHKAFFSDNGFFGSVDKSFLNQTTLDLRKKKMEFVKSIVYCIIQNNVRIYCTKGHEQVHCSETI